jgi:FKBP-type peptidyl-prolyl cis-trans isomerase
MLLLAPVLMLAAEKTATTNESSTDSNTKTEVSKSANTENVVTETKEENMTDSNTMSSAEAFLKENAKQEGVVILKDNLQYRVLESGEGPKPNMHSSVTVHYEGKLLDGKEFDSSFKRNEPATFNLDQVIKGWTETLTHMNTGATWMVYIGPDLAYGDKGIPGIIPPNSVLVFKIKLIKVNS